MVVFIQSVLQIVLCLSTMYFCLVNIETRLIFILRVFCYFKIK